MTVERALIVGAGNIGLHVAQTRSRPTAAGTG